MNAIDAFDLEAYLQKFSPNVSQADELVIACPACGKNKLVVNVSRKAWHCWRCEEYRLNLYGKRKAVRGAGGLIDLIQLLEGCTRERAAAMVMDQARHLPVDIQTLGGDLDLKRSQEVRVQAAPPIPPPPGWLPVQYDSLAYLRQRGILMEDVMAFGLVYCATGPYANRLIFPVWEGGHLVYWQARAMWDSDDPRFRKAMNPPRVAGQSGPAEVLMNLDRARRHRRVAVTEGPIDCIHAGPSSVATFGKRISMTQALKLRRAGVRSLDLMWDGPTEREPMGAWPEMMRAASLLAGMFDVHLVFLPHGDPGDYTRSELDRLRGRAVPASAVSRLARV
ncbi:MAG: hypothetical protein A2Y61_00325 [Chloroflexi bacterium RBG_13_60_13]|nr:MAG: hypothetical protein A2Y61_00325 [Chloroflexi bacterium RBG_13_60_13]